MAANPLPGGAPTSTGSTHQSSHSPTRTARWAVGTASVVAAVIVLSAAIFAVAYAIGGVSATEDNWVGFLAAAALLGGLAASLAAFILAVVARVRHERWAVLWLPLVLFPALSAFVVLGELFWWE